MKKCKDCKKEIMPNQKYWKLQSIQKETYGKPCFMCDDCMTKYYIKEKQTKH